MVAGTTKSRHDRLRVRWAAGRSHTRGTDAESGRGPCAARFGFARASNSIDRGGGSGLVAGVAGGALREHLAEHPVGPAAIVAQEVVVESPAAAVLAAVADGDLGEASAVNDVAARLGGAVMVALVPLLIGVDPDLGLAAALRDGYQRAMIVLAVLAVAAAVARALFVRNGRTAPSRFAPPAPHHGCSLPDAQPPSPATLVG